MTWPGSARTCGGSGRHSGWRQKDLAARCGVNLATISAIEGGVNSTGLLTVIRLARIFEVSLDQLTGFAAYTPSARARSERG